jgi:ArsR family transcriptional regulator, arsenate/arsenite/antimonite-responsive transcriptional repressor
MREFLAVTKALSDENRVRTLMFLANGELCLCQIIEMVGLAPSTVSKHMAVLTQARLVETRKEGRWMYYRLAGPGAPRVVVGALDWIREALHVDRQVTADRKRVAAVRHMPVKKLCCHYKR